jgi:hypothetical protein
LLAIAQGCIKNKYFVRHIVCFNLFNTESKNQAENQKALPAR